ncbi:hypothetical protein DEO72_LG8g1610 [Vigna unguiculata]|uniref:Uncharacterized protein n=1 Tax=Vigna unguiculata TaxID=3917 RepID=A0A4D6MUJ7_VIGUN|nr:hypothetical protein DEO72_LG8g1610 [Vigna unguiculata]
MCLVKRVVPVPPTPLLLEVMKSSMPSREIVAWKSPQVLVSRENVSSTSHQSPSFFSPPSSHVAVNYHCRYFSVQC